MANLIINTPEGKKITIRNAPTDKASRQKAIDEAIQTYESSKQQTTSPQQAYDLGQQQGDAPTAFAHGALGAVPFIGNQLQGWGANLRAQAQEGPQLQRAMDQALNQTISPQEGFQSTDPKAQLAYLQGTSRANPGSTLAGQATTLVGGGLLAAPFIPAWATTGSLLTRVGKGAALGGTGSAIEGGGREAINQLAEGEFKPSEIASEALTSGAIGTVTGGVIPGVHGVAKKVIKNVTTPKHLEVPKKQFTDYASSPEKVDKAANYLIENSPTLRSGPTPDSPVVPQRKEVLSSLLDEQGNYTNLSGTNTVPAAFTGQADDLTNTVADLLNTPLSDTQKVRLIKNIKQSVEQTKETPLYKEFYAKIGKQDPKASSVEALQAAQTKGDEAISKAWDELVELRSQNTTQNLMKKIVEGGFSIKTLPQRLLRNFNQQEQALINKLKDLNAKVDATDTITPERYNQAYNLFQSVARMEAALQKLGARGASGLDPAWIDNVAPDMVSGNQIGMARHITRLGGEVAIRNPKSAYNQQVDAIIDTMFDPDAQAPLIKKILSTGEPIAQTTSPHQLTPSLTYPIYSKERENPSTFQPGELR